MSSVARLQDLPPRGGYSSIPFKRVPPKSYGNGYTWIAGYLGVTFGTFYLYWLNLKLVHRNEIEQRSACFAIYPMLLAERDREFLKQLRRNRDEEANLMKNVDGWKVGTWYGEPVYTTLPADTLVTPKMYEYYVHSKYSDYRKRAYLTFWS